MDGLKMYILALTSMIWITFISGRTLVVKPNFMDNKLVGSRVVPNAASDENEVVEVYRDPAPESVVSYQNLMDRDQIWQHSDPVYKYEVKGAMGKQQPVNVAVIPETNGQMIGALKTHEIQDMQISGNKIVPRLGSAGGRHHKGNGLRAKPHPEKVRVAKIHQLKTAHRMRPAISNGDPNAPWNGSNLPLNHKAPDLGNPQGTYKRGHMTHKQVSDGQRNGLYEGNPGHKSNEEPPEENATDYSKMVKNGSTNDRSEVKESNTPLLDIPNRFLKIPSSELEMQSLLDEIVSRHPCIKQVTGSNHGKLNLTANDGARGLRDNVIKAGERIRLCKLHKDSADIKTRKNIGKHRKRHNKPAHRFHAKAHFDGHTIYEDGKQLKSQNEVEKRGQTQLTPSKGQLNISEINRASTSKGRDTADSENLIRGSSPLYRGAYQQQQITPKQEKDQQHTINYHHQIGVFQHMTNGSLSKDDVKMGSDLIIWCSGQTKESAWTRDKINGLLDEVVQPECWHASALKEIYKLEGDLYSDSNEPMSDIDSGEGQHAISEVICYLVEETKKCLLNRGNEAQIGRVVSAKIGDELSQLTSTISTTTQKPMTSSNPGTSKGKVQREKYTLSEKLDRLDQSDFGLEWEANMLFY